MGDIKVKGYRLKNGELFVPYPSDNFKTEYVDGKTTFSCDYLNSDFVKLMGGIDNMSVGSKIEFANGYYLQVTSIGNSYGMVVFKMSMYNPSGGVVLANCVTSDFGGAWAQGDNSGEIRDSACVLWDGFWVTMEYAIYNAIYQGGVYIADYKFKRTQDSRINMAGMVQFMGKEVEEYSKYKGDTSGEGGYGGSFDKTSDTISLPSLPNVSASNCGFVDLFKMSLANTLSLSNYLWTNIDEIGETLRKVLSNPMDAIISLSLTNITLPDGADVEIKLGGLPTGVHGQRTVSQFAVVDCGTITVPLYWGTALDYSPNAKAEIYLPCIGTQPINIDDILGKNVQVVYHCDLLSGACIAYILINGSVMYQYTGNVITQIPLSSSSCLELYKAVISTVGTVATASATGDVVGAASSVANLMGSKPTIQRGGTISGNTGSLCIKKPYITLIRAEQSLPSGYQEERGFPCNVYMNFSELHGYSEIESVKLKDISATDNEKEEIMQLLMSGVIF